MDRVDCIIAGAGAIGLCLARALAARGHEVLVVERNGDFGLETSGRNSEVIHAGIYYPPGSLKARLCREGRDRLVAYLAEKSVPHRLCGKLIVATAPAQQEKLAEIEARARANGVSSLRRIGRDELAHLEPDLAPASGLLSPETGIFDSRAYMFALLADMERDGGAIAFHTTLRSVEKTGFGFIVETEDAEGGTYRLACRTFFNAAGLHASEVGRSILGQSWPVPETRYARGTYYQVEGRTGFRHLVYPVPEPGGLGIHLTLDMQGASRFGPDVEWIETIDYRLTDRRRDYFRDAISKYWPGIAGRELHPAYCGIRPKGVRPGEPDADFLIAGPETHGVAGLVQLFGIESPGLTSSLAIADHAIRLAGIA